MDDQTKRLRGGAVEVCPECDIAGCRHIRARAALAAQPAASAEPSQGHYKPPFDNCSIKLCDLPGQRRGEGKCHHPGTASALTASEAIEFRTAAA